MNNTHIKFETMDWGDVFDLVESKKYTCYEYYSEREEPSYQEVIDKEIALSEFKKIEDKILRFIKQLENGKGALGYISSNGMKIRKNYTARRCQEYYKKTKQFEKDGRLDVNTNWLTNEIETGSVMAIRGAVSATYYFKELGVIILILWLHGVVLFENNESIPILLEMARKSGLKTNNLHLYDTHRETSQLTEDV